MTVRRASALSQPPSQPSLPPFGPSPTPPPPPGSPLPRTVSVACTVCAQTVQRFATGDRVAAAEAASMTGPPSCRRTAVAERARWSPEVGSVSPNVGKITGFWPFLPQSGKSHSEQINFYSSDHHLCFPDQHGFRTDHSTPPTLHCSHWLTMYVQRCMDRREATLLCLLDCPRCFDRIPHDSLLRKLELYGVDTGWFRSYLSGPYQRVQLQSAGPSRCPPRSACLFWTR